VYLFFFAALLHAWSHWYYMMAGLALYAFDKVTRMVHASRAVAVLHLSHAAGVTRLEVSATCLGAAGHAAGQYAFVQVPALGLFQWHPFTISSPPAAAAGGHDGERVMTFHIKSNGLSTWTGALADLAATRPRLADLALSIDGPYGNAGHYYERDTVVLVAGGIGVTPMHAILGDLHARATAPAQYGPLGAVKRVHFVWVVRETALLYTVADTLAAVLRNTCGGTFVLHLATTERKAAGAGASSEGDGASAAVAAGFCTAASAAAVRAATTTGRPDMRSLFASIAAAVPPGFTGAPSDRVSVLTCGPSAMVDDISRLAFAHSFDFHSETFYF